MKAEIATRWANALNSGKYIQGEDQLATIEPDGTLRHCCLGVLCELYFEDNPDQEMEHIQELPGTTHAGLKCINIKYFQNDVFLPAPIIEWAGMKTEDGVYDFDNTDNNLVNLNDRGVPFYRIAETIELKAKEL